MFDVKNRLHLGYVWFCTGALVVVLGYVWFCTGALVVVHVHYD